MDLEEIIGLEPESPATEHTVYELFKWSLLLKGAVSVCEVITAMILLIVPSSLILSGVTQLRALAGSSSSYGFIASHLLKEVDAITTGTIVFVAIYLLTRGLVKIGLVIGLLKNQLWAYPASLVILSLFVMYQLYQIIFMHSIPVVAITLFDLVVMYLIWREWRIVRRHIAAQRQVLG